MDCQDSDRRPGENWMLREFHHCQSVRILRVRLGLHLMILLGDDIVACQNSDAACKGWQTVRSQDLLFSIS